MSFDRVIVKNNINQHPNGPDLAIEIPISPIKVIIIILCTFILTLYFKSAKKTLQQRFLNMQSIFCLIPNNRFASIYHF